MRGFVEGLSLRGRIASALIAFGGALCLCPSAANGDPLVTDRPDFTESAAVVPQGRAQIETGYTFTHTGGHEGHALGEVLIRVGVFDRVETRVGINSYAWVDDGIRRTSGLEDGSIGLKILLSEGVSATGLKPATALILEAGIPYGASGLTTDAVEPSFTLCLGSDLSETVSLGANAGGAWVESPGGRRAQWSASLTAATAVSEMVGVYAEWFGLVNSRDLGPNTNYVNGGMTLLFGLDTQFDGRIGVGLNSHSPDYFVGIGISRRM